jgi:hypothetical protein
MVIRPVSNGVVLLDMEHQSERLYPPFAQTQVATHDAHTISFLETDRIVIWLFFHLNLWILR